MAERGGIDGVSDFLGFRWTAADELDRRNGRLAVLRSEVTAEDGRLLATAIGSYTIFPRKDRPRPEE